MGRRSLMLYGILLLCIFMAGCSKRSPKTPEKLSTKDTDMNNDNEEGINEDADMIENENPQEKGMKANAQEREGAVASEAQEEEALAIQPESYTAGAIIDTADFTKENLDSYFYIKELNQELIDRIYGKSYKEDADIPYSDLRYIRLLHIGFDGLTHVGELIVNEAIADDIVEIFKELYAMEYPIEKIHLVDEYDADDNKSMEDNNTSCFNYRSVPGTQRRSVHSDGRAIDINPLYNPYIRTVDGELEILPENGKEYADRDKDNPYYIRKDDPCYKAFTSRGFNWGGEWKNSKDYQHFEKKASD